MAIIKCSDCGNDISTSAATCPHCGRPNDNQDPPKRSVGVLLGLGIFLLPIIFSWFTLRKGHTKKAKVTAFTWLALTMGIGLAEDGVDYYIETSSHHEDNSSQEIALNVSIEKLLSDYENNEIGADARYKDRIIMTRGIISSIKKDIMGTSYVTLGTGAQFQIPELQAMFDDSTNSELSRLNKGSNLTVACRIDGLMMNVIARDCSIM
ncbi:hypothetical protein PU634_04215 [Oceanimonas pelagia]|uniref:Zinc ribbon domain-containing protein n=1 Tax=Oceanimonas pelagia TaxID=3028314 RepID=A0AA50QB07_9GAMM|nr:hypothetical protein [Oceanimonas pelagia]WMC11573.1 hypothetical protein PU634_04215 [Oceanimonas pelagia]